MDNAGCFNRERERLLEKAEFGRLVDLGKAEGCETHEVSRVWNNLMAVRDSAGRGSSDRDKYSPDMFDVFVLYQMTISGQFPGHCTQARGKAVSILQKYLSERGILSK